MQVRNKQRKTKTVLNRWNRKKYMVVEIKANTVRLKREDGSVFTITKSEFNFSYFIKK